jgi:hypothetical protein
MWVRGMLAIESVTQNGSLGNKILPSNVHKNGSFVDKILPSNEAQVRPLTQLSDAAPGSAPGRARSGF